MLDQVLSAAGLAENYRDAMLADLTDGQWTHAPAGLPFHPASIIGHLAVVHGFTAGMLEGRQPEIPTGWMELLAESAQARPGAVYPGKDLLMSELKANRRRVVEWLKTATAEALARPMTHPRLKAIFPTVGALAVGAVTVHDSTHAGQLSAWRRALGLELAI
jgi:hypothetical protein